MIKIAVIGLGHIGPNHVRVFSQCEGCSVEAVVDVDAKRREHLKKLYPQMNVVADCHEVIRDASIDAVVIATPTSTHYSLTKEALEAGKHVFLEKPMCIETRDAEALVRLAAEKKKALVHGHIVLYIESLQYLRQAILRGDFGRIQYVDTTRTNLGPIRNDINVIQDLAAHEFATFDFIFGGLPIWISAASSRLLGTPREDVAFISMAFPGDILVHTHVSWLHPQKNRLFTLVGDKKMAVWNDMDAAEPIRVFDKGIAEEPYYDTFGQFRLCLRDADMHVPKLPQSEPLKVQAQRFVDRIRNGSPTLAEAETGLRVMKCLDATMRSLKENGKRIILGEG